ncbi:MAG: filamentous hemagglutinin N-terminal domain-containing protein [Plectolyngbya sp. WJT66-NPBG17]|jgi:filamentous hemagglutinin family protein|nr:filamentous hemagglutinin N-terminal domain-containing protein [Plectolyngbya sp. WJT66-NPBG17]
MYRKAWILTSSIVSALLWMQPIAAQVAPDATLPVGERSQVSGSPNVQIDGGTRRGGNLFHSFSQFSVPTGEFAYFNNATDVQNIFSRVTGGSVSNIDGLIRANGRANLFFLNPNGVLFGPNARLNIRGSFIATTANSINFADNFQYSATNPQTSPLLTVSVPIGLQMGANPGLIGVRGNGYNLSSSISTSTATALVRGNVSTGLQVSTGQTLALLGGDIDIQGGVLTAEQGRIELGSARDGIVNLRTGLALSYPGIQQFGDIHLSQQALVDASGAPGGSIAVQGNQVSLTDGSLLLIQNQGEQAAGSVQVNATDTLELNGISSISQLRGGLNTETIGSGRGGDIAVSTRQLLVQDGAGISAPSYGAGRGGDVTVAATDSIQLTGSSGTLISRIFAFANSSGNGGNLTLSTQRLSLLNGSFIGATAGAGSGNAGNVTINATQSVELIGFGSFTISNVGSATSSTSTGNGGNVTINTPKLVGRDGGSVTARSVGTGRAGSVTINATESAQFSGVAQIPLTGIRFPSQASASAQLSPPTAAFPNPPIPNQPSGDVTINTRRLSVTDGAKVDVSHEGTSNAGTLRINANSILLDRGGTLTAATAFGEGGNIDLNVRDFVLLRNGSPITASARGTGNGGNIRINTGSIIAVPTEDSDIRANSVNRRGGNITINTSGIFGIQTRSQDTSLSDITATGATSAQSGTVQLNIDRLDPASGLAELPTTIVDSSRLIAQSCPINQNSSFVISGRGGLPPTPDQELDDDADWQDRRRLSVAQQPEVKDTETRRRSHVTAQAHYKPQDDATHNTSVIEAIGWQRTLAGEVILVANTSNSVIPDALNSLNSCQRK